MAKRYSPEVSEAIWSLLQDGIRTGEIERRLRKGTAGVPPTAMPRRTLNDHIARMIRERGLPHRTVNPGQEAETAAALTRSLLESVSRTASHLEALSKTRALNQTELGAVDKAAKITQDIGRRLREPEPSSQQQRASRQGRDKPNQSRAALLARLSAETTTENKRPPDPDA